MATSPEGREIIVTDSIVFALPEDSNNVLVTAGHTGRSGAKFLLEVSPHGFICSDGGMSKNNAGITGLETTEAAGLAGACCDAWSAPVGDAFKAFEEGTISACNGPARDRGVEIGMTVPRPPRVRAAQRMTARVDRELTGPFWAAVERG